jgi:DUF1680 family protein
LIEPNPRIDAIRGSLAIAYGPLVYCLEGVDQPAGTNLSDVRISPNARLNAHWREDMLGKVMEIKAQGAVEDMSSWESGLYCHLINRTKFDELELTAIPYYAWANRWVRCASGSRI